MNCCEVPPDDFGEVADGPGIDLLVSRRSALKGLAGALGGAAALAGGLAHAEDKKLRLAFCGQLLCVVPYEVTRARGHFKAEGLDVELVYTRGGGQAMQALVGGAVDYAGTSFDVALLAFAKGAKIRRFASTGRLPLFALATAPKAAGDIKSLKDLEGRTVAVSALGNADHSLLLYLLKKAGADTSKVRFAALGTNLYDALRLGQVDAGMVQEPALSLISAGGGGTLVNVMELHDANHYLGGAYEFMGVAVRAEERDARLEEMRRLARALAKGLEDTRTIPIEEVVVALPRELIAGGNRPQLLQILERYRKSLYPETVKIDVAAAERVAVAQKDAGVLTTPVELGTLLDTAVIGG
jgi:NitT/TauT family transport system substrate-binding protein